MTAPAISTSCATCDRLLDALVELEAEHDNLVEQYDALLEEVVAGYSMDASTCIALVQENEALAAKNREYLGALGRREGVAL